MCIYGSKTPVREESRHYGSKETLPLTTILPHQDQGTGVTGLSGACGFRGAFGAFVLVMQENWNLPTQ